MKKKLPKMGWIKEEERWLRLLEARKLTSHTYDQEIAKDVYLTVKENFLLFSRLLKKLKNRILEDL